MFASKAQSEVLGTAGSKFAGLSPSLANGQ